MIEVVYFFLFQSVAINMAYMPAHMRALGLSGRQISTVSAVAPVMSLVVPLGWAWLADRTRRHDRVLRLIAAGACLGFVPVLFARGFAAVLVGYIGYALFSVGLGGITDALAVSRVRAGAVYGRLRLWGSLGYVLACLVGGALLGDGNTGRLAGELAPLMMCLALAATLLASLWIRGSGEDSVRPRAGDVRALLGDGRFRLLLLAGALHWVCMAPYNVYFGIFLRELGLPPLAWGAAFSVGVLAEMLVLLWFHRLEARFALHHLLAAAFLASSLRWLAVAVVHAPAALIFLQVLHGMTFGLFWSAAIALVGTTVPAPVRATGQALLVVAINVGAVIGNSVAGRLYYASGPRALFLIAAVAEVAPLLVVLRAGRRLSAPPARS